MQFVPEHVWSVYTDKTISDDMAKSQYLLTVEPREPTDRDYFQTLSVAKIREHGDPHYIIAHCDKFLSEMTVTECRFFTQDIRIWQYEKLEQYDKAIALRLEKIKEHDKKWTQHEYRSIIEICKKKADTVNAIKYYELYMVELSYNVSAKSFEELAELYDDVKDYENSAKYHSMAAVRKCQSSAENWQLTGRALSLAGQYEEAMFYFRVALKIDPTDALTHHYMGHIYQRKKDKYRALHHYAEALKIEPEFMEVHLNSGLIELEDGEIRAAIKHFEAALKYDTENKFSFDIYARLRKCYDEIKDFEKAAYYRLKYMELAGFSEELLDYLDARKERGLEDDDDEDDEEWDETL